MKNRFTGDYPAFGPRIAFDAEKGGGESEAELKKLAEDLQKAMTEVKTFAHKVPEEIKNLGKLTEETKSATDKALTEMNGKIAPIVEKIAAAEQAVRDAETKTNARLVEMEQKLARRGSTVVDDFKSIGQQVVENAEMKAFMGSTSKRGKVNVTIELKTITSAAGSVGAGVSAGTSLVPADRMPEIVGLPLRRLVVRDLITPGNTISSHVDYVAETGTFTPVAAAVSEGQTKPYSNVTFNLLSSPVRTLAAMMKASRQILDDAPMLSSFIDGRLRYELQYVEEGQLLSGDGTGQNLLGIIPQATAYAGAFAPVSEQAIDRLRLASLQATLALFPATGYVLHPTNWAQIELLKDSQGRYIIGQPQGQITPTLWGLPVVNTQAMTVNKFLTGAFKLGAQIFDRMSIEVLISTENSDDFERNLISIRGEERLALCVYRPAAFVYGTLP